MLFSDFSLLSLQLQKFILRFLSFSSKFLSKEFQNWFLWFEKRQGSAVGKLLEALTLDSLWVQEPRTSFHLIFLIWFSNKTERHRCVSTSLLQSCNSLSFTRKVSVYCLHYHDDVFYCISSSAHKQLNLFFLKCIASSIPCCSSEKKKGKQKRLKDKGLDWDVDDDEERVSLWVWVRQAMPTALESKGLTSMCSETERDIKITLSVIVMSVKPISTSVWSLWYSLSCRLYDAFCLEAVIQGCLRLFLLPSWLLWYSCLPVREDTFVRHIRQLLLFQWLSLRFISIIRSWRRGTWFRRKQAKGDVLRCFSWKEERKCHPKWLTAKRDLWVKTSVPFASTSIQYI